MYQNSFNVRIVSGSNLQIWLLKSTFTAFCWRFFHSSFMLLLLGEATKTTTKMVILFRCTIVFNWITMSAINEKNNKECAPQFAHVFFPFFSRLIFLWSILRFIYDLCLHLYLFIELQVNNCENRKQTKIRIPHHESIRLVFSLFRTL